MESLQSYISSPVIVRPDTFNDDNNVVLLFNVEYPDTFNDDIHAALLMKHHCNLYSFYLFHLH